MYDPLIPPSCVQNFVSVYEKLRDALLEDKLLGQQPGHSKEWLKQVSGCKDRVVSFLLGKE